MEEILLIVLELYRGYLLLFFSLFFEDEVCSDLIVVFLLIVFFEF